MAEVLSDFGLPAADSHSYEGYGHTGSWYATNSSGTYMVSGQRVVMFENVHLPREMADQLVNLLSGALWKEGYLLSHELFLRALWPHLPGPFRLALRGTSQLWLMLTLYRAVVQTATPLVALVNEYRKAWEGKRYQGTLPIGVNDAELSFKIFLQAHFPEKVTDPVAVDIDRVPEMKELPALVRPHGHLNPWGRLLAEMAASDIQRLQLAGLSEGGLELRFRDTRNNWRELVLSTSLDSAYQPVPWLLEMVRQKVPRDKIRLYASLLSQDVIDLAGRMLACRRLDVDRPELGGVCPGGRLMHSEGGVKYFSDNPVAPPLIWEKRDYDQGRVLPLTGCSYSDQALCWENYLIWGNGTAMYPWPILTLYTRFSSFRERNNWILLEHEPQVWYTGSYFQLRVPELVTRAALAVFGAVGQISVNRLVTSMHHRWWGNGAANREAAALPQSESPPNESLHADESEGICSECGGGSCQYPACIASPCGRYKQDTMVDLGCGQSTKKHLLCTNCFKGILANTTLKPCTSCQQYHPSMLNPDYYLIAPGEGGRDTPSAPMCPLCRSRFDSRLGNVRDYLFEECGALWEQVKWLFSDSLTVDSQEGNGS